MCIYIYTCMYLNRYIHICRVYIHICIYLYPCMLTSTHIIPCIRKIKHMFTNMYHSQKNTRHLCLHVYIRVYTYIQIYIYVDKASATQLARSLGMCLTHRGLMQLPIRCSGLFKISDTIAYLAEMGPQWPQARIAQSEASIITNTRVPCS